MVIYARTHAHVHTHTLEKTICILNITDQLTSGKHGNTDDILKWYLHFLY